MKCLLDPIYTNDPGHCASNVKMKKIVQYTLERRKDVFFYWLVPDWATDEELKFYDFPGSEGRVKLIKYPYSKDRMREYMRSDKSYYDLVSFTGELWDVDIVVSNRVSMAPFIKAMMVRPMADTLLWSKKVFLIEDMPLMSFKLHAPVSHPRAQEIQSMAGYLAADYTCISAFWEKDLILKEGRKYWSPSGLDYIDRTMVESSAVHVDKPTLKTKASIQRVLSGERPFTIAFIGRMTHNSRAEDIFEIIGRHWIMRGKGKVRGFISTQSKAAGRVKVPSWMEMHRLPREGFWDLVKNEIDCFVFLSAEEDYSMSLMEPLLLGCPAVLIDCRWSRPTVGNDYPFFVKDTGEAYARVREFYHNYAGMYKAFAAWQQSSFNTLMQKRNEVYVPKLFYEFLPQWEKEFKMWKDSDPGALRNEVVQLIMEWHKTNKTHSRTKIWLKEAIEELDKLGKLKHLAQKLNDSFADRVKLVWQTDWNVYRLALMGHGYTDAGVEPGVMSHSAVK